MRDSRKLSQAKLAFGLPSALRDQAEQIADANNEALSQLCRRGLMMALADVKRDFVITEAGDLDDAA